METSYLYYMNIHAPSFDSYGYLKQGTADYDRLSRMFCQAVQGGNFMTPIFLGYVEVPNGVAEITSERDIHNSTSVTHNHFFGSRMYGVTVVIDGKRSKEKSKCFYSYAEVVNYIDELNRPIN